MAKVTSLRQATSMSQIAKLTRDNFEFEDWSIMTDGMTVWISMQRPGQAPKLTNVISVPKRIFDRLLKLYEREQKTT